MRTDADLWLADFFFFLNKKQSTAFNKINFLKTGDIFSDFLLYL